MESSSAGFDHNKTYFYDLETYPNCFLFSGKWWGKPEIHTFELSPRKFQRDELLKWLSYLNSVGAFNTGFNNIGFDYPIIHDLIMNPYIFDSRRGYLKAMEIIHGQNASYGREMIHHKDRSMQQIDLIKINHFDNPARRTSLKTLQFAMRLPSVEDLPFEVGRDLTNEEIDVLIKYNIHDLDSTEAFYNKCKHLIDMRWDLLKNGTLTGDVLNYSDVKLGEKYLITKIGRHKCYKGSKPIQTSRSEIRFKDIILKKIFYRTEEFQDVLEWFKQQIHHVHGEESFKLSRQLAGLQFEFGVGGVHASVESKMFESNDSYDIIDVDVAAMYPSIAVANGFHPEHLGTAFLEAYKQLQLDRKQYKKGTPMNAVLKLANNGVFGKGDNKWSAFYDPRFPKQITINGQLQLLQLAESLSLIPGLQIIQANTDGITAYVPKKLKYLFDFWKADWERETQLTLEEVTFKKMWIRDVNNYLALKSDGTVKRKGAYWYPEKESDYDGFWNKDFSRMIVEKTIEHVLVKGVDAKSYLKMATNPFDFMCRYKTPGGAKVYIGDQLCSKTVRYYVSVAGAKMKKVSEPTGEIGTWKRKSGLKDSEYNKIAASIPAGQWDERIHTKNKSKHGVRENEIEKGFLVKECNDASKFNWDDVNWDYYAQEIEKLIIR